MSMSMSMSEIEKDDWIKLDYESIREGSTFVTFGPASSGP